MKYSPLRKKVRLTPDSSIVGNLEGNKRELAADIKFIDAYNEESFQSPHCDQAILHSPGVCVYCDHHPLWQKLREQWRINFSDTQDPDKAPCPSTYFRKAEVRDLWSGNVAWTQTDIDESKEFWKQFQEDYYQERMP